MTDFADVGDLQQQSSGDLCDCLVRLYELVSAARQPTLSRAEMTLKFDLQTEKSADSSFTISVKTSDHKSLLATQSGVGAGITWSWGSLTLVPLLVEAPGTSKDDCDQFSVSLRYYSPRDGTIFEWVRITLYFSDGTTLVAEHPPAELNFPFTAIDFSSP